jgi:uncharacterized membrane protein YkoI
MKSHSTVLACLFVPLANLAYAADGGSTATTTHTASDNGPSSSWSTASSSTVNPRDPRDIVRRLPVVPLADASAIALGRVSGTLLAAEIETNDGIRTWQIDIQANDGHRVRMWLNANTGAFLRMADR